MLKAIAIWVLVVAGIVIFFRGANRGRRGKKDYETEMDYDHPEFQDPWH